jgi:hypothetical protein
MSKILIVIILIVLLILVLAVHTGYEVKRHITEVNKINTELATVENALSKHTDQPPQIVLFKEEVWKHMNIVCEEIMSDGDRNPDLDQKIICSEEQEYCKRILCKLEINSKKYFEDTNSTMIYYVYCLMLKEEEIYRLYNRNCIKIVSILEYNLNNLGKKEFVAKNFVKGIVNVGFLCDQIITNDWLGFRVGDYPNIPKLEKTLGDNFHTRKIFKPQKKQKKQEKTTQQKRVHLDPLFYYPIILKLIYSRNASLPRIRRKSVVAVSPYFLSYILVLNFVLHLH